MTTSVACKTLHVAPPVGQFIPDPVSIIVGQNGCDQGPANSSEFNLMEMTEVEYTHLQHIIQSHMDAPAAGQDESVQIHLCKKRKFSQLCYTECSLCNHPESESDRTTSSPQSAPAACQPDASSTLSTDEQDTFSDSNRLGSEEVQEIKLVLSNSNDGEKTPTTCVEVPNSVLAKVKYAQDRSADPSDRRAGHPLQLRPNPPARVCLEKRFSCSPSNKSRQQDTQAAVLNTFLSMLHHSTDTQGVALLSQSTENCPKAERMAAVECAFPYGGSFLNSHVQDLGSLLEDSKHPELIPPKHFTFSYRPDKTADLLLKTPYVIHAEAEEQGSKNLENEAGGKSAPPVKRTRTHGPRALQEQAPNILHGPESWKQGCMGPGCKRGRRTRPPLEITQRKERHNSKERDRRRRIRLCCDELNLLVPFCNPETDKATTLQWTTAFLKYIKEVYGDSLKQEFESTFCGKTGVRLKPSSAAVVKDITESRV
ncbi:transcription factor-like 5 protein [Salminus brasiliensis]|uniref:transcription factor-like 5 protein n=1 Tax=Salminus brasiliensis TaxID=930266 RepID=UPI003B834C20